MMTVDNSLNCSKVKKNWSILLMNYYTITKYYYILYCIHAPLYAGQHITLREQCQSLAFTIWMRIFLQDYIGRVA